METGIKDNAVAIRLDRKIYPIEVVYGACYNFIDRCYVYLDGDGDKGIVVRLKGKASMSDEQLAALEGELTNELLSQALRKKISQQNQRLREYIVSRALFAAQSGEEEIFDEEMGEDLELEEDFLDDPLQIAVPWDEKYGTDKKATDPGASTETEGEKSS
jgi:His-Xaa-Ser system protein HxsD